MTIIAHSNGGLVAKALLKKLQDSNDPLLANVNMLVLVAVPQTGTPHALGAVLHGYGQALPTDTIHPFLSPEVAREFAYSAPMAYHLLPSANYFESTGATVQTPLFTFLAGTATGLFRQTYGENIDNPDELHNFLLGLEGRALPLSNDLVNPVVVRANLLSYATEVHQELDDWVPPESIEVHEIAGWGLETVAGITYDTDRKCVERVL